MGECVIEINEIETQLLNNEICKICFDDDENDIICNKCNKKIACTECLIQISKYDKQCPFCRNDIEKILIKNNIIKKTLEERYQDFCKLCDPIFRFLKILFWISLVVFILMIFSGYFYN